MSIVISQTPAIIGIDRTTPSRLEINTQDAQLKLHQKHAKVNIETELPVVEIDQYEAFASSGLKNNRDLIKEAAQKGYQQAMEFIAKYAADGNRLAAIEKGGNPMADIVARDAFPEREFGVVAMPSAGPRFSVRGGTIKFDPEKNGEGIHNGVEGNYIPGDVNFRYTPAGVNIYLRQHNSINIKYQGTRVDTYK